MYDCLGYWVLQLRSKALFSLYILTRIELSWTQDAGAALLLCPKPHAGVSPWPPKKVSESPHPVRVYIFISPVVVAPVVAVVAAAVVVAVVAAAVARIIDVDVAVAPIVVAVAASTAIILVVLVVSPTMT